MDADGPDCGVVAGLRDGGAGPRGVPAANHLQSAFGVARRRFLRTRARGRVRRCTGRSHAGGQHAGRHAARTAAGRVGGDHAAAHGDVGDRRSRFRLRPGAEAAPGESRRRAAAGGARRARAGSQCRGVASGDLHRRRAAANLPAALPARRGGPPAERVLGASAEELHLETCIEGEPQQTFQMTFPGGAGRWGIRRRTVREHGLPLQLLVVADLTLPLRQQELQAWQRLVRVLGHELNNSLTPIKSIAGSLGSLLTRHPLPTDWEDDMRRGLSVISTRSEALSRFIGAYARLAKLPRPQLESMEIRPWVQRVVNLETRLNVAVKPGPDIYIHGDPDQLEQVLINLLRNAADASLITGGGVHVGWTRNGSYVGGAIEGEGPGISNTTNLFVPFFTTKPGGSGIGLVLSRQIAEAHGGTLVLENRADRAGCVARLRLPV